MGGRELSEFHRKQYEDNQLVIMDGYTKLMKELGRVPTISEIARETGYNLNTISEHLKRTRLTELKPKQRLSLERVLSKLTELAVGGDLKAINLYLKVVGEWVEKSEVIDATDNKKILKIEFSNGKNVNIDKQLVLNQSEETEFESETEVIDEN